MSTTETTRGQFTTPGAVLTALFAGNAIVTVVSKKSGERFTVKVSQPEVDPKQPNKAPPFFVKLLAGPDNVGDFVYVGILDRKGVRRTQASRVGAGSAVVTGLSWLVQHVVANSLPTDRIEVWHEGRCARCGRRLTVPSSIASGLGPDCAERIAEERAQAAAR